MSAKQCTIRILDEVFCIIAGLRDEHYRFFYDAYAIPAPNYFFNPKFKLGVWDGKLRFFHKEGKTYIHLLDEIIPALTRLGYAVKLDDKRLNDATVDIDPIDKEFYLHIGHEHTGEPTILRDHQVEGVNIATEHGNGIIIAGTGAGKTILNAALVDLYGRKGLHTVTIVPNQDLITQTHKVFVQYGLDVGQYWSKVKDTEHKHVVSTWQALQNNPKIMKQFQVVVVDECQGAKGNVIQKLLNDAGSHIPYRFGLTGTLPKEKADAMAIKCALGPVRYTIRSHELIEKNHLARLDIEIVQLEENLEKEYQEFIQENDDSTMSYKKFKDCYFPDYHAEKNYLQKTNQRVQFIADLIMMRREEQKGNVFCLVNGVAFGKKLAQMIPNAHFVHGKDDTKVRRQIYDLFAEHNDVTVIATVNIASAGLDIPRIFHLFLIDIGKSFVRTIQSIGRGLRKAHDKDYVLVTDVCSDLKYAKKHVRERIKYYDEQQFPNKKKVIKYTAVDNQ